ncbi:MAG: amidohydrolase family protein [Saprospiraceae bacterium]|nr:amidohydrolase family protein [Saprospiraceae bacterium]
MKNAGLRLLFAALAVLPQFLFAQQTFPVAAPSDQRSGLHAFTNATIYTDYKTRVEGATLLIREGKIVASGLNVNVPKEAVLHDATGKTIYPAFIDLYATGYGLADPKAEGNAPTQRPQQLSNKKGAYAWNEALKTEYNASGAFANDSKTAEEWRKNGFGALLTHRNDGISRGTGALVVPGDEREHLNMVAPVASHHLSFRKGTSTQDYPSSLIGVIALIRQTFLDGQWYKTEGYKSEKNLSIEAWNAALALPQIFEAGDKLDILRIQRIGEEFGTKYIVKTAGDEYQRLDAVKASGQSLIVPLNFPEGYDVRDPYDALNVPLKDLKHWELAPANASRLEAAGISFALTAAGLKDKSKFMEQLRKAIEYGLSEEMALKALTYNPASFLNTYDRVGSLEAGKWANFIITDGAVFQKNSKILETWVKGAGYTVTDVAKSLPSGYYGEYNLSLGGSAGQPLVLDMKNGAVDAYLLNPPSERKQKVDFTYQNGLVTLSWSADTVKKELQTLSGYFSEVERKPVMSGKGTRPDGSWFDWNASWVKVSAAAPGKQDPVKTPETGSVIYPFIAFGRTELPMAQPVVIRNATVWTGEKEGVLTNTDVLVSEGKIQAIGKNIVASKMAQTIDGTGMHLTAGIIDEHSHIAVSRNINEGTQESSAEVRIGDALDSEDSDIYRQLAGGVTASHLLHGSANPIGGQTQLIKLRWGVAPEDLKVKNWPGQIKFALGENVKQANWGENTRTRYPQTRMGVEQVFVDYFTRAQEYGKLKKSGNPYRKDLELEALAEILDKKRFITCHSYVQSEIVMLMRVAERFGFNVNTFTHIREGYKVADKMAKHGVGGSTFSDWWAYKYEVYEAIPQNAKMMADRGVVVSINSDDAEMARRLNQEAAKSVMYAGMSEVDAWNMVTINPAKLLHVDDHMGSIKKGKDADLVLWNDNPLSIYARAEKTWVDGALYFDRADDARQQEVLQRERARIIQKIQAAKKGGEGGERPSAPKQHYHCDSEEDEG